MCERYSLGKTKQELESRFEAEMLEDFQTRYNIAPTQLVPIITLNSPKGFSHFYWGVTPEFSKNKPVALKFINTKAETVHLKASSKNAFKRRRCIIPADGYFGWKKVGKKTKIPHRFTLPDSEIFSFAGIWEEYENDKGDINHTFQIITVEANEMNQDVSDRMPVIFRREQEKIWLDKFSQEEQLTALLQPFPTEEMISYPVSPMVNQISVDAEFLIKRTGPMDQFGNYTLFG
ncbi:SOS response-associated peptidase [Echinicola sp. CAU 1574]|uniref:Abasic site processing protein n=1 Tax=Echinicola arenosa TaxID=2774144 RepID=A0ABR9AR52_9BACT|nr:SOS response-associated peptidase [Echinicola arenosa]MBD8491263.1 SOS response-associated peptidase [Echinicola arenosa]